MQGQLVDQDSRETPASELLKEIAAERKRLVKRGDIREPKPLPVIKLENIPYLLPTGWEWVRLGTIGVIFNGNSISSSEKEAKYVGATGLPYIATKDVGYGTEPLAYGNGIYIPVSEKQFTIARQGSVLICAEGGSAGRKCGVTDRDVCFGNKLFANELQGGVPSKFVLYFYMSACFQAQFAEAMTGIIGGVSIARFTHLCMPIPPLAEQFRIVAKIDELMKLCSEVERLLADRDEMRTAVHVAAVRNFINAVGRGDDLQAVDFITRHLEDLVTNKTNITVLRKAFLRTAILGNATRAMKTDSPVVALLDQLLDEQGRNSFNRVKDKEEIRKELHVAKRNIVENRVDIKTRLFCSFITKGTTPAAEELSDVGDVPFLKVYNIVNNTIDFNYKPSFISGKVHQGKLKRSALYPGDVIMNIVGPPLGRVAVVTDQFQEWNMNQALAVFRPMAGILSKYVYYALLADHVLESVLLQVRGTAGQDNLSLEQCRDLVVRIPSIEEQNRIVHKVDRFMELCDSLEELIDLASETQSCLLDSVVDQLGKQRCA